MADISSDDIKTALTEKFGGVEGAWKRTRKGKDADGNIEREFRDNTRDITVTVTETPAGLSFTRAQPRPAPPGLSRLETNPEKIAAAKKIVARTLKNGEALEDVPVALLRKAGPTAYANQFVFAIVSSDPLQEEYNIYINGAALFKKQKVHDDDTVHDIAIIMPLLPKFADDPCGGNYYNCVNGSRYTDDHRDVGMLPAPPPLKSAQVMLAAGFIWDENYQKACEEYSRGANTFDATQIKSLKPLAMPQPQTPKTP